MRMALIVPVALIILNAAIYLQTEKKITKYAENPPFMAIDLTKSYKLNRESVISNLLDNDPKTQWLKLNETGIEDFIIELRLSHKFINNEYIPEKYQSLFIRSCSGKAMNLTINLFLREAINVDKELRMPDDQSLNHYRLEILPLKMAKIDISGDFKPQKSNQFPENIGIIGLKGKIEEETGCISDIFLQ